MKQIEEDTNGKISHVLVKCPYYPKPYSYRINTISVKIPMAFFTKTEKNPKICMGLQKTPNG